jgi:cytochrome oxidase Cu insertion factor (SCO1/SenC/PrrC family)
MLRALLLIVALLILLVIGAVWFKLIDLNQTQTAQAPKFEVKVNPVTVGTTTTNVQLEVPRVEVGGETANQQ